MRQKGGLPGPPPRHVFGTLVVIWTVVPNKALCIFLDFVEVQKEALSLSPNLNKSLSLSPSLRVSLSSSSFWTFLTFELLVDFDGVSRCVFYYCRTYYKAVRVGGGG
jgi:hypothetical protein